LNSSTTEDTNKNSNKENRDPKSVQFTMSNSQASKKVPAWMQSAGGDLKELDPEDNFVSPSKIPTKTSKSMKSTRSKASKKVPVWMGEEQQAVDNSGENFEITSPQSKARSRGTAKSGTSKGSKRVPAWMMPTEVEVPEDLETDPVGCLNDTNMAMAEVLSRGSRTSNTKSNQPSWMKDSAGPLREVHSSEAHSENLTGSYYDDKRSNNVSKHAFEEPQKSGSHNSNEDSARWTQNRSYFLRMNKIKEQNKDKNDWARLNGKSGNTSQSSAKPDRNATIRALTDELEDNKAAVRQQANEIEDLQEHINELQAQQMQEESERVEAEIAREKVQNENARLIDENRRMKDENDKFRSQSKVLQLEKREMQEMLANLNATLLEETDKLTESVKIEQEKVDLTAVKLEETELKLNQTESQLSLLLEKETVETEVQTDILVIDPRNQDIPGIQVIFEEESSIYTETEANYDSHADDEQTVLSFRNKSGISAKTKKSGQKSAPVVESSSEISANVGWSRKMWRILGQNTHILQNAVIPLAILLNGGNLGNGYQENREGSEEIQRSSTVASFENGENTVITGGKRVRMKRRVKSNYLSN